MTKFKKISRWIIVCFAGLVVLLAALTLIADRIIKQERVLSKIQAGASQAVGGKVELKRLELSFFPQPNIIIHQASFSIPDTADGTLESLTLYPQILPLFTGKFLASRIDVQAPDIKMQFPKKQAPKDKDQKPLALEDVKENVGAFLSLISEKAPGLYIAVKNGRLNVLKADNTGFEVKGINARIDLAADAINLNIRCKSGRWEKIFLKGTLYSAEDKSALTFAELKLDPLGFKCSGKLEINHPLHAPSPSFDLELKGKDVDVRSVRKVALNLVGDIPVVQDIFNILKGGRVPLIIFTSHGNSLEDLGKLQNINIKARMLDGEIFVPEVNLDLTHVKGDVIIAKGVLQGSNLEARLGNSQGRQGALKLGFEGDNAPFHLDVTIDADLAQLPSVLKSLVDNESFVKELALVKDLQGKVTGRLILGESLSSIETHVEVKKFNLSANYRRLPYLLNIQGEQFSYKNDKIALKNVNGSMSKSYFSGLSGGLDFKESPYLEIKAGQSTLLMDEIYPWLSSYPSLKDKLQGLQAGKGVLSLSAFSLQGPPSEPEKWRFQTAGDLALQQGLNISADLVVNPDELIINKLIIKDRESNATCKLDYKNSTFKFYFKGNLNKTTLDNLMKDNKILGGWVKGDFHTNVLLDQPANSTAHGDLQVKDFAVTWQRALPVTINTLSLNAKDDNLHVELANLSLAGNRFDLKGDVNISSKGVVFDIKMSADEVNLDNLKKTLEKNKKNDRDQAGKSARSKKVQGVLKLKTEKLIYERLTWSPFYADISIKDSAATVTVTEAILCGIATPGTLKISPQEINIDVKPVVRNQGLQPTFYCLLDKSVKVDGNFNFQGSITTTQRVDETLLGSLNGGFNFDAGKGRFHTGRFHGLLSNIFSLLSITEIFRGKMPDIGKEGFGYNSFKVKADIQNGKVILNEAIIDGTSMNIVGKGSIDLVNGQVDGTALVAPLKTVDAIVKKIPLVKDILGGSLVSIPISIKGSLEDPKVTVLSSTEVDSGLLGIMRRTLQLPVKIIEPAFSDEGKK